MTGYEVALVRLGQAVVTPVVRSWLADRRRRDEARLPLSELVGRRITDRFGQRRFHREVETMVDIVAERLAPLEGVTNLPDHERQAVLDAVGETFTRIAGSDEILFASDAQPERLAAMLRLRCADVVYRAGLDEVGQWLYRVVLDECCEMYVQMVVRLAPFPSRAAAEILSRTAGLGEQVALLLDRLQPTSLDAPSGTRDDGHFRMRYLRQVAATLDESELFGVGVRNFRPRTPLSVSYISLVVSTDSYAGTVLGEAEQVWSPGRLLGGGLNVDAEDRSVRVEQALAMAARTLVRGEAGSGKTTVLRWLAVTAARQAFTGDLTGWNGYVPFLVMLRRYADVPLPGPSGLVAATVDVLSGQEPVGWAHRQLASGTAILLVDGVDEVGPAARRNVRDWLRQLLVAYPDAKVVVTSRPAAATARWLSDEGFRSVMLDRMAPADVRALIARWHRAITAAGDLPCDVTELPRYENALLGRLDASADLHTLATNPLLCAMLCALNLDRRTHLPRDRIGAYTAAVELLLERRDSERGIVSGDITVGGRDLLQILQYLAAKMSINNEAETDRQRVLDRLTEALAWMPQVHAEPAAVLDHLLHRSGLLRQPVEGRIDFVHRTFQEFLTARETADRSDVGLLVDRAHRDSWRGVVVMAAGHANAHTRNDLIRRLLDRADEDNTNRRALRLLAVSCLETVPALDPVLLDRIDSTISDMLPPRSTTESRSLAAVGEPVLRLLPKTTEQMSPSAAAGTIRTVGLINGPTAFNLLTGYAHDERAAVQRELARVWEYFDPDDYALRVLADAPLDNGYVKITNPNLLPATRHLHHLTNLVVSVHQQLDLAALDTVGHLSWLLLWRGTPSPLNRLDIHRDLRGLRVENSLAESDPSIIPQLSNLSSLFFFGHPRIASIDFLRRLPRLALLGLGSLRDITDWSAINDLPELRLFSAVEPQIRNYNCITRLGQLTGLSLLGAMEPTHPLDEILVRTPTLDWLRLNGCAWVKDVRPISNLQHLEYLDLSDTGVSDLTALAMLPRLRVLSLARCSLINDLSPLAIAPSLKHLDIRSVTTELDLSPFAQRPGIRIYVDHHQRLTIRRRKSGNGPRLRYLPPTTALVLSPQAGRAQRNAETIRTPSP